MTTVDITNLEPVKLTRAEKQRMDAEANTHARRERGKTWLLDGVGGDNRLPRRCRRGLLHAGMPEAMEIFNWQLGWAGMWIGDVICERRNRYQVALLRRRVRDYQREYPDRPIRLIGHSGGAALVTWCLEKMPPGSVADAILLSPALSPGYDLTAALTAVKRQVIVIHSPLDIWMIGLGTLMVGTVDRRWCVSAGVTGFRESDAKLRQIRWSPKMMKLNWYGGHNSSASTSFSSRVLAPMLTRNDSP